MKIFIISLVFFTLMLAGIVLNFIYINKVSDELYVMAYEAPAVGVEGCYAAVSKLDDYWQKNHDIIRLSVSFVELNQVSDAIVSMKSYAKSGSADDYENARQILLNAIHEMRRLESFKLSSLF
jgi:hypothetical protein